MENLEEIGFGSSTASFLKFLDSQKQVFHCQIDQLQQIVVTQCNLTGVNPLSQEMAAGAMSVKIGKRPRDLLNPKAIKYMQAVFSMKDAISKKECRLISAQFGITVTQVRDFFATQRTRVRKLVRLSREKAIRANQHKEQQDEVATNSDPMIPIDLPPLNSLHPDPVPLNSVGLNTASLILVSFNPDLLSSVTSNVAPTNAVNSTSAPLISIGSIPAPLSSTSYNPAPLNSTSYNPAPLNSIGFNPAPLNSIVYDPSSSSSAGANSSPLDSMPSNSAPLILVGPSNSGAAPSCSTQDEMLPGIDDRDKIFVENIFSVLRKEETFYGQEKLMEWILQIQNPSVLSWFLSKGGVMILATWLSQAAAEEQTSLLIVTLKVLCHLPLQKAVPEHMSAILHSVNRLRFYRTSDISNRARILLSRWSKLFARVQALKKPNGMKSSMDAQEMILKQSIEEIMSDDLWMPNENVLALCESSESNRKTDSSKILKLLPASTDDSSKKYVLGVSSSHTRKRRKVQLVEQPGQKIGGRSPQSTKAYSASQARPMSADDIQKAKMRALYLQGKFEKTEKIGSSSIGINGTKTGLNKPSSASSSSLSLASKVLLPPKIEDNKKSVIAPPKILSKQETHLDTKLKLDLKEPLGEVWKRVQIPWHAPPEMKLDDLWRVGTGENSKEVDVQRNRNRREIETIYRTVKEIPSNPKEPWDLEMDYDDTLTPDIPIEQPPDPEVAEPQVTHDQSIVKPAVTSTPSLPDHGSASEPDLELLAVLLKNPELVFALTSGNSGTLSPEDTVKLLDMIKKGGTGLVDNTNERSGKVGKVEVSLPSPTPSSNPGTAGWRLEAVRNPFSQQNSRGKRVVYTDSTPGPATIPALQPQNQERDVRVLQQQGAGASKQVQTALPPYSLMQTTSSSSSYENKQPSMIFPPHQHIPANSSMLRTHSSDMGLPTKNLLINAHSVCNFHSTGSSMQVESTNYVKPAQSVQYAVNAPERRQVLHSLPPSVPIATRSHPQVHMPEPRPSSGHMGPISEPWRSGRQGLGSNSVSLANQANYEFRGPLSQTHVRSGSLDRNGCANNDGFESWSPDNSPTRSPGYMPGRNYPGAGTNPGWNYNPDNRARQQNYNSENRDQTRNGNRRRH